MSRVTRTLVGLAALLSTLLATGIGSTAFAMVGPPDNNSGSSPSQPTQIITTTSGLSGWAVLLIVAGAAVVTVVATEAFHYVRRQHAISRTATA